MASQPGLFNFQALTNFGELAAGYRLYTYAPSTTTQKNAFTDQAGTIPHTYTSDGLGGQYIALDARGELPAPLWLASGGYDIALKTPAGVTVWTRRALGMDDAAPGAGSIAFDPGATYSAGSVGKRLVDLASSIGATLVGWISTAAGGVLRTLRDKAADHVNVKDFGAVADGTFVAGGSASGTDNLAAFNAALAAAVSLGVSRVKASGVFRLSGKLVIPRGITLEGDGTAHLPIFLGGTVRGTVLLIAGAVGDDCLAFEENAGHTGLRDLSVYNTNTNAIRAVVSVVGQLYPRLRNVEISSLRRTTGSGLYVAPSSTGLLFETLWGDFDNVMVTITNIGTGTEASVRYGANFYGITSTRVPNANVFKGGQLAGCWSGVILDGAAATSGPLNVAFFGVKIGAEWDGTFTPQFQATASKVFGFTKASCYIWPSARVNRGFSTAFHGCYFENSGAPSTFNDGTNGVQSLVAVVWLDSTAEVVATGIVDCNWNSVYLYDNGNRTLCTPTTDNRRHDCRIAPRLLARSSAAQSIPNATWTKVQTPAISFGDDSYIEWDATNGVAVARAPGTYLIGGQVTMAGWAAGAGTYAVSRVTAGGLTINGNYQPQNGAGNPITSQVGPVIIALSVGDTITFEAFHNQGGSQNTTGSASDVFLSVTKAG